jgi:hypothetical protein
LQGCASWIIRPGKVILLPEERIYSLPAGQEVTVTLDNKPLKMVFPETMKVVSPTVLVRQEQKLNNAVLDKAKANSDRNKTLGLAGGIIGIIGSIAGAIFFKKIKWPTFKFGGEIK